jgi:pimeloyl-ACP methyl ester carboxylesterase
VNDEDPPGVSGTWREIVARFGGRSHWIDIDGPLHYAEFTPQTRAGALPDDAPGPPLPDGSLPDDSLGDIVLVHGLGGSFVDWLAIAPLLADGRRVLVPDLPGHGLSPGAGRRPDLPGLRSILDRFLTATQARRPLLIGNSLGGAIVALQAAARPRETSGIVLLGAVLPITLLVRPHPLVVAGFAAYAIPWIGARVVSRRRALVAPEPLIRQSFAFICAAPDLVPEPVVSSAVRLAEHRRSRPPDDAAFLSVARDIVRNLVHPRAYRAMLNSIETPVLMIHGSDDRFVPLEAARRIAARQPRWQSTFLGGVGHVPQLEAAEKVAGIINSWQESWSRAG